MGAMGLFSRNIDSKSWFKFAIDHPFQIIAVMILITFLFGWRLPKLRFQTSIYDLAIKDLSESMAYQKFKEEFGTEEIILVVVKSKNTFDPEIFQKAGGLSQELSGIQGIRRVISLPSIKKDMDITDKWSLPDFERIIVPIDLFHKNLISADKMTTIISLILEDKEEKDQIIRSVEKIIERENGELSLYQIGMPLVSKALADYTEKDFLTLPPITFLVMALVLLCLFHSLRGVLIPAGSVLVALIWTFGLMAWTETPLSMLTMIVPVFVIAVGTAYCLYVFAEYLESAKRSSSAGEAARACFSRVGFPTTLAVMTTLIGLGSLLLNKISGIREFALFSSFGIGSILVVVLLFQPAIFALLPLPPKGDKDYRIAGRDPIGALLSKIVTLTLHKQRMVFAIFGIISLMSLAGIYRIKVETNPVGFFRKDTPISQHFHDIYQEMAGSFPIDVVLDGKVEDYYEDPEHLEMISRLQHFLDSLQGVDKTISFADYIKLVNYASNQYSSEYYTLPKESFEVRTLMNSYKTLLGQDMFDRFMNADLSKANILLRTHISSSRDFLLIKDKILSHLQEHFPEDLRCQVTGFGIVLSQSSHLLTKGQVKSISLTLVLIFGVMLLLFLSGKAALVALVPIVFPIIVNFGLMGWLGLELSVVTSLIACIAIGLAVDDIIHYLVRYNNEFKKDLDKDRALRDTIKSVGRPIIFTTLVITLGFSILTFSHFKPTAVFGVMMVIIMASALMGDIIILPSLMLHVELVTAWDLLKLMRTQAGISPGMAHELNQPLNAIKMGSEFLMMMVQQGEKIPQEQLSEVVQELSVQADRAAEIVNRFTDFDFKRDFSKEAVDITRPIKEVLGIIGHQLQLENIEWSLDLDKTIPPISAHGNRLRQGIFNLVINAWEAINQKGEVEGEGNKGRINIRSFREDDRVVVTISDNGVGIPRAIRHRIFEPFFTTKAVGKGKGLGLSITHHIVKDYGGRIDVESKEGAGTTLRLTFPIAPV
jgi:predicted RND superfamily exporter protein